MSTREYAQMIFDRLTDEQVEELVEYIEANFLPEPPNTVHSASEINAMLEKAEDDVRNGRVFTKEEMDVFFKENFGI